MSDPQEAIELKNRWELIRQHFLQSPSEDLTVQAIAGMTGWFESRHRDRVSDFVSLTWERLQLVPGFGPKKIERLIFILEREIPNPIQDAQAAERTVKGGVEALEGFGVPREFPLKLARFSARVIELAEAVGARTAGELLQSWEKYGESGLLKFRNVGRRSVTEIEGFYRATLTADEQTLAAILPLRQGNKGLFLPEGIMLVVRDLSELGRRALHSRLCDGWTLGRAALDLSVSRERVRQFERELLEPVAALLEWFGQEKEQLFAHLMEGEPLADFFAPIADEKERLLAENAVKRLFQESTAGIAAEDHREELCGEWLAEVVSRPSFYLGELTAAGVAEEKCAPEMADFFARFGRRRGEFHVEAGTGTLVPKTFVLKRIVSVFLETATSAIDADALLQDLRRIENFQDLALDQLRRNYLLWRRDEDFPQREIHFSGIASSALLHRPRPRAVMLRSVPSGEHPLGEPSELEVCNRCVTEMLARSGESTILGLLPIAESDQERITRAVREAHSGVFANLMALFTRYPGALDYTFALAAGAGMQSTNFWEPVSAAVGIELDNPRRHRVSDAFQEASCTLNLLQPTERKESLLWPILFQAGIVPQFVPQLAQHIRLRLGSHPPPDFEDNDELAAFALAIRERIPKAWVRLRELLASAAGSRVCVAVLQAHRADDFDLLPPHLRIAMREAFAGTSRELYLAAPHLRFRQENGDVALRLPAQPRRLLTPASSWILGGERTFGADNAVELPVQEFRDSPLGVDLCHLRPPFEKWSREIPLWPSNEIAAQIFRLPAGRQHPIRLETGSDETRLPAGNYAIVVRQGAASNIQEGWNTTGNGCRWIEYESFPGQSALEILDAGGLKIRPREDAAILVSPGRGGGRLIDLYSECIFHGETLELSLWVPQVHAIAGERFELRVADAAETLFRQCAFDGTEFAGGESALDHDWICDVLGALPAGIHSLRFELISNRCSARREILFWKGFLRARAGFGFECAMPLANVDFAQSRGVRATADGLALAAETALSVRIALVCPPALLQLAPPGVSVALHNEATGEALSVAHGTTRSFGPDDPTRLVIDFNDPGTWELLAGQTVIRTFAEGSGRFTQRIASFFHEFGEVVTLMVRTPGGVRLHLLTLTQLAIARSFSFQLNVGENSYSGGFGLPADFRQLGVAVQNSETFKCSEITTLELAPGPQSLDMAAIGRIEFQIEPADAAYIVTFRCDRREMQPGIFQIEFHCRKDSKDAWTELKTPGANGIAGSRICLVSEPFEGQPENFFSELLAYTWNSCTAATARLAPPATEPDRFNLASCFRRLGSLLDYAYCDDGWRSVKWMRFALTYLCERCATVSIETLAAEAVRGVCAKSAETVALYRPLAFGMPELWALQASAYQTTEPLPGLIAAAFAALGRLGRCASINAFLQSTDSPRVDIYPLRFSKHASGGRCLGVDYDGFLRQLAQDLFESEDASLPATEIDLLSCDHFRHSLNRLDRAIRVVLTPRSDGDTATRHRMISELLRFDSRLPMLAGLVKSRLGMGNATVLDIELFAPSPGPEVRRLLLTLTALARLRALDSVSEAEFQQQIARLFADEEGDERSAQKALSLLAGLAPDFFSCAMLFWEITLRTKP